MKRKPIFGLILAALFLVCLVAGPVLGAADLSPLSPTRAHSRQCLLIVRALEQYHFSGKKMDPAMSVAIFDRYIKHLDPGRHLLTQEDMSAFQPYKHMMYRAVAKGNLVPAFDIFNQYQVRSGQRLAFILNAVKTWERDLDFSADDTLVIDQELRPFQKNETALTRLWEKELKNHIIALKLDDKSPEKITQTLEKIYSSRLTRLSQTRPRDAFQIFMNAVTTSFDPHTQYFPPRVSEDFDIHMSLSLEGIGAVLQNEYEYTKVVRLIPKGPADKSHLLMPGDKIIGVGQGKQGEIRDTIGQRIDDVVKLIRGPKDTYVRLKIIPAKKANATTTISIKRDKVKLEEQSAKKEVTTVQLDGKSYTLGIIEIPNFYIDFAAYHRGEKNYKSTSRDVAQLLFQLKEENIDGLIVDLRDNGGGSLKEANDLTGLFLKSGPTVQIKTKHRISRLYDQDPSILYTGPLVVLINRMSASASEIFAGAIKDYNRGIIVGTTSFGKGTVQELKPLGDGRLKLTSAKFYRVSGKSTQHKGIAPDIAYPQIYKAKDTGESSLDGALLWDRIMAVRYLPYRPLEPVSQVLGTRFSARAAKDPGMGYLQARMDLANELMDIQTLSLNLETRRKMNQDQTQKELALDNEYRKSKGQPPLKSLDQGHPKLKEFKEILMKQTQYLAADYIRMTRHLDYAW